MKTYKNLNHIEQLINHDLCYWFTQFGNLQKELKDGHHFIVDIHGLGKKTFKYSSCIDLTKYYNRKNGLFQIYLQNIDEKVDYYVFCFGKCQRFIVKTKTILERKAQENKANTKRTTLTLKDGFDIIWIYDDYFEFYKDGKIVSKQFTYKYNYSPVLLQINDKLTDFDNIIRNTSHPVCRVYLKNGVYQAHDNCDSISFAIKQFEKNITHKIIDNISKKISRTSKKISETGTIGKNKPAYSGQTKDGFCEVYFIDAVFEKQIPDLFKSHQ
jgi:hypothetical protein